MSTSLMSAIEILITWLNTPFKSLALLVISNPGPRKLNLFSITRSPKWHRSAPIPTTICVLAKSVEFTLTDIMSGGSMKILRQTSTSALVRFKAGSIEPAHHHTFGHDLVVLKGSKKVWNLSKEEKYDLGVGGYLFTPVGDVHRVKYFEDTKFFINWDGHWTVGFVESMKQTYQRALKIATNFGYLKESPKALVHGALISAFLTVGNSISDQGCV